LVVYHYSIWFCWNDLVPKKFSTEGKKQKLGLLPGVRMANNGFHGSYSWHVMVAGSKGIFSRYYRSASMDSNGITCIIGYRVTGWINGVNAFHLFSYTFTADSCLMAASETS
jgi:hypothetical protein